MKILQDIKNIEEIKKSLFFLNVQELKTISVKLALLDKGKKIELINGILHFLQTGKKLILPRFPEISCAKRSQKFTLFPHALMLKGAYKNDLKTRLFFKHLIGEHFHFTAYGIDWLDHRWMNSNPPTYQEFANMWQTEYLRRRDMPDIPKPEWAYINFVQDIFRNSPCSSKKHADAAWKKEREKHIAKINTIIEAL